MYSLQELDRDMAPADDSGWLVGWVFSMHVSCVSRFRKIKHKCIEVMFSLSGLGVWHWFVVLARSR